MRVRDAVCSASAWLTKEFFIWSQLEYFCNQYVDNSVFDVVYLTVNDVVNKLVKFERRMILGVNKL